MQKRRATEVSGSSPNRGQHRAQRVQLIQMGGDFLGGEIHAAMVVFPEARVAFELAGEHAEQQGECARSHNAVLLGFGQQHLLGFAFEQVVAYLDHVEQIAVPVEQVGVRGFPGTTGYSTRRA
jgi:hypothetical protein